MAFKRKSIYSFFPAVYLIEFSRCVGKKMMKIKVTEHRHQALKENHKSRRKNWKNLFIKISGQLISQKYCIPFSSTETFHHQDDLQILENPLRNPLFLSDNTPSPGNVTKSLKRSFLNLLISILEALKKNLLLTTFKTTALHCSI